MASLRLELRGLHQQGLKYDELELHISNGDQGAVMLIFSKPPWFIYSSAALQCRCLHSSRGYSSGPGIVVQAPGISSSSNSPNT